MARHAGESTALASRSTSPIARAIPGLIPTAFARDGLLLNRNCFNSGNALATRSMREPLASMKQSASGASGPSFAIQSAGDLPSSSWESVAAHSGKDAADVAGHALPTRTSLSRRRRAAPRGAAPAETHRATLDRWTPAALPRSEREQPRATRSATSGDKEAGVAFFIAPIMITQQQAGGAGGWP